MTEQEAEPWWTGPMLPDRRVPDEQVTGLLTAVGVLRLAVLGWAAVVVVIDLTGTTELRGPAAITTLVALTLWTVLLASWTRSVPTRAAATVVIGTDVAMAGAVAAMDHWIYAGDHPQTFASAWPLGAVVTAGILRGPTVGAAAGAVVGAAGALGTAAFRDGGLTAQYLSSSGTLVLFVIAGALAGVVTDLLRRAEHTAARARAREEFARELHDGVLQTLAVVQRRSDDAQLVSLAREQELELRRYVERPDDSADPTGSGPGAAPVLGPADTLHAVATAAERRTGLRCEVVVVDDPPSVPAPIVEALRGAVGEALTNADKHGGATRAVICLELDDAGWIRCSVSDDGSGFDPAQTVEGLGISRSIRARLDDVGGRVELHARPGEGCEVVLWAPASAARPRRF